MRLDTGVRYSNVHYKSKDHYIVGLNGDNSGKTTYEEVLPSVALSWQIIPEVLAYASYAKGLKHRLLLKWLILHKVAQVCLI
jgi:iron complex outermembrane receptor protein